MALPFRSDIIARNYSKEVRTVAILTREQILAADDLKTEVVACPEWGGDVNVATMDGPTRWQFDVSVSGMEHSQRDVMVKACAYSIRGEDGKLLFTPGDIAALGKKSSVPLVRVFEAACRVSKLFKEGEVEKKSETTPPSSGG